MANPGSAGNSIKTVHAGACVWGVISNYT